MGGLVGPQRQQRRRAGDGARSLRGDVHAGLAQREVTPDGEGGGDRGVVMGSRQMAAGVDHHHDDQPEHEADADTAE